MGFEPTTTEFRSHALADWVITASVRLAFRGNFVQLLQFHLFLRCSYFISVVAFVNRQIFVKLTPIALVVTSVAEWINRYGIHHWRIFGSSYRKLAWVGFEDTTNELRSGTLNNWAIAPWVQIWLRANFVQLLQLHLLVQCSRFILTFAFFIRHICFNRTLA